MTTLLGLARRLARLPFGSYAGEVAREFFEGKRYPRVAHIRRGVVTAAR